MKRITPIIFIALIFSACKKDVRVCEAPQEITGREHLTDISLLTNFPKLYDTILKYELQVWQIKNDDEKLGFKSNVFFKNLPVFQESYYLYQYRSTGKLLVVGNNPRPDSLNISLTPTLPIENAIDIAEQHQNFTNNCISYRLGIFNIHSGAPAIPPEYRLIWKIQGDNGYPYVMLDANDGTVYRSFDGIEY